MFGSANLGFSSFGKFDLSVRGSTASGWSPEGGNSLQNPGNINIEEAKRIFARFNNFYPVIGILVPRVSDWASENLDPELFRVIGI